MITTKKANFYIHKINRQEKSYEWKKKKEKKKCISMESIQVIYYHHVL